MGDSHIMGGVEKRQRGCPSEQISEEGSREETSHRRHRITGRRDSCTCRQQPEGTPCARSRAAGGTSRRGV